MISALRKSNKVFLLALMLLAAPLFSSAQGALTYSVSPTIFDMTANPGQTWQSTVRIINPNPFDLTLYIDTNNFIPKEEDGIPQFVPASQKTVEYSTLAEWIETQRVVTIAPEQSVELPVIVRVPQDAPPGGHYAALMISTKPNDAVEGKSLVQTSQIITSLIFLRVTGDITENSTIRSFRTSSYFLSKPEATFELRVENKGNVHLQPQGEIKIYNMWGQERGSIPINQQTMLGNVLPQSVRKFAFTWTSEWSITDIGRYTAKATLAYGVDERQFLAADTAFWIIPWKIILGILVVVGSFIALISWALRLYVRHVLKMAGVVTEPAVVAPVKKPAPRRKALTAKQVTAPLEAGILDLRSRLHNSDSRLKERIEVLLAFVRAYWKFFAVAGVSILFVGLLVWFIKGALTPERPYEVTDAATGAPIASSGGEGGVTMPALTDARSLPIALVNRTGDDAIATKVAEKLTAVGFRIATTTRESGEDDQKTVIVYSPDASDAAVLLSRTLNDALLSSFTSTGTSTEKITVYIGKDAVE